MTTESVSYCETADKIARLVDKMAEVFSNASIEVMLHRVKVFKPLLNTIATMAKTLATALKLKKNTAAAPQASAQVQEEAQEQQNDIRRFSDIHPEKQEILKKRFAKKAKRLANAGYVERANKLEEALKLCNYDQAMILARLYGMIFTA